MQERQYALPLLHVCVLFTPYTYYYISHRPDAFDFCLHHVAWLEKFGWVAGEAHTAGGAGGDNVSWLKCHAPGKYSNDLPDREDHHTGICFLLGDAIHAQANGQLLGIRYFIRGHNPWPHWAVAINAFPLKILPVLV